MTATKPEVVGTAQGMRCTHCTLPVPAGLIASGAVGNLIDRIRSVRGVVDFLDVGLADSRFYTFNVADSFVTVGAVLLAILLWRQPDPAE